MISAIRVEAVANDPAQAKAEIDTLLDHIRMIGRYEGIIPSSSRTKGEVYDVRDPEEYITGAAGGRFWFEFAGRKILEFEPEELPHNEPQRPQSQHGYQVTETNTLGNPPLDVTEKAIVVERRLPMDWPSRFVPFSPVNETEEILHRLGEAGIDFTIKPIPHEGKSVSNMTPRWRMDVSYGDGTVGFHTVGATIHEAASNALGQMTAPGYPLGPHITVSGSATLT